MRVSDSFVIENNNIYNILYYFFFMFLKCSILKQEIIKIRHVLTFFWKVFRGTNNSLTEFFLMKKFNSLLYDFVIHI